MTPNDQVLVELRAARAGWSLVQEQAIGHTAASQIVERGNALAAAVDRLLATREAEMRFTRG